jgi:thiol-disulfide isomerase/thioredoxin
MVDYLSVKGNRAFKLATSVSKSGYGATMMGKRSFMLGLATLLVILLSACTPKSGSPAVTPAPEGTAATVGGGDAPQKELPAWFDLPMTDVQSGETFTISDFAGKVVLVETMAMWCPNCVMQANEVRDLHNLLGNSEDLISISLDVDVNESAPSLKDYSEGYGFDWRYAVAPLEVARALGNLYSAQYLNPPLSPMLLIDRKGEVHELPYGRKDADDLLKFIQPYLDQQ